MLDKPTLRAAVAAEILSEAQAASLLALAQSRSDARSQTLDTEEPFELFKGFNEIFIMVGLSILYGGWMAATGINALLTVGQPGGSFSIFGGIGMVGLYFGARYFTLKRRMVGPSILLTLLFAATAFQVALSMAPEQMIFLNRLLVALGVGTLLLLGWYIIFRVPITVALIALGCFAWVGTFFVTQGALITSAEDFFLLSNGGPFAWLTIVMGLIGFGVAMRFDMSDPHRISRRSSAGFWLHIVAAPAIINTLALTLLEMDTGEARLALLAIIALLGLVAIVIDRRSFLVAGVGYVIAVVTTLNSLENTAWTVFALGGFLVLMGAQWERWRGAILRALPAFPGKTRLPPYQEFTE